MSDLLTATILPYSLVIGIITTVVATVSLVIASFRGQSKDGHILARLSKIEAEVRKDTQTIEVQIVRTRHSLEPERARSVMADLSTIAVDLERKTGEMQAILSDLRTANARNEAVETTKQIASLGIGVGETESRVKGLLKRIEREQRELSELNQADAVGQN